MKVNNFSFCRSEEWKGFYIGGRFTVRKSFDVDETRKM